jgi:hypothetical protein
MSHEVLVERRVVRDEYRKRLFFPAPRAPGLLPRRGDAPRITDDDRCMERPDVDPELEGVRADHGLEVAAEEPPLDLAPLLGEIAASVGMHGVLHRRAVLPEHLPRVARDDLAHDAGADKGDRLHVVEDEPRHEIGGLDIGAPAFHLADIDRRRVPEQELLAAAWATVFGDDPDLPPEKPLGVLAGIGDRRRRSGEHRMRAVVRRDSLEPPHDVRDVRTENAAVRVDLVDHDVLEPREKARPLRVIGKNPRVEHVGIREEHFRLVAEPAAARGGGVAVIGARLKRDALRAHVPLQDPELILRERFRRIEVERAGLGILEKARENGNIVAEGLTARGGCDDDDIRAAPQTPHRLDLVHVELLDTGALENLREPFRKRRRELAEASRPRRNRVLVGDLPLVEILDLHLLEKLGDFHGCSFVSVNGSRKGAQPHAGFTRPDGTGRRSRAGASSRDRAGCGG